LLNDSVLTGATCSARKMARMQFAARNKKARHFRAGLYTNPETELRSLDVGSLLAFRTLNYFKGDLLAFFE
jgi:hypothetical protein